MLSQAEGALVTVEPGFDAAAIRVVGNVTGNPPFKGALRHHGWRLLEITLPARCGGTDGSAHHARRSGDLEAHGNRVRGGD